MKIEFRRITKRILKKLNLGIVRYSTIQKFKKFELILKYLEKIPDNKISKIYELIDISKSQIFQDLFVLYELDFKRNGYFVEFGATNGIDMSNTYLLEKKYNWRGILAEPAIFWHDELEKNRSCQIDKNCIWKDSESILKFNQVSFPEFSTINSFMESDQNKRKLNKTYDVYTISLNDLLEKYNAPKVIDYLSIDTEGSEYEILSNFDFNKYDIKIITCEHNLTPMRDKIFDLLTKQGYQRKHTEFSRWDDWYVKIV